MQIIKIDAAERLAVNVLRMLISIINENDQPEVIEYIYSETDQSQTALEIGKLLKEEGAPEITDFEFPSAEVILEKYANLVRVQQKQLLMQVNIHLQDDSLSDAEVESLKQYRLTIKQLDQQAGYPSNVVWPTYPDVL